MSTYIHLPTKITLMELYLITIVATMWLFHSLYNMSVRNIMIFKKILYETGVPLKINSIFVKKSGKVLKINLTNLTEKYVTSVTMKFVGLNKEGKVENMIITNVFDNNVTIKPYFNKTIHFEINNEYITQIDQHYVIEVGFDDGSKWLKNK